MKLLVPAFIVLSALLALPAAAQDIAAGRAAFDRGDYTAALRQWQPLAVRGNADAQASLGLLYARGHGVPKDYGAAVRWFHEAAQQGHALGQNNLGVMYRNGHGVPQDFRMAITLYRLSAAQGYALAQASLGAMHQNGEGTPQDFELAYMWYTLAAEQGHQGAVAARRSLGLLMSDEEKWRALALARDRRQRAAHDPLAMQTQPSSLAPAAANGGNAVALVGDTASPPAAEPAADQLVADKAAAEKPAAGETVAAAVAPAIDETAAAEPQDAAQTPAATPAPPAADPAPAQAAAGSGAPWRVQLSALRAETEATAAWQQLQQTNGDLLRGLKLHVQQAELPKGTYFRVQAGPLADRASAASLCDLLKSRNQDCLIVVPEEAPAGQL